MLWCFDAVNIKKLGITVEENMEYIKRIYKQNKYLCQPNTEITSACQQHSLSRLFGLL